MKGLPRARARTVLAQTATVCEMLVVTAALAGREELAWAAQLLAYLFLRLALEFAALDES